MKTVPLALCSLIILGVTLSEGRAQENAPAAGDESGKSLPPRLQNMVETYERERTRLLAPIEAKYDQALLQLKVQLTKRGDINGAIEVNKLIALRSGNSVSLEGGEEVDDSKSKIANTRWKWGETSGILELKRNGDAMHTSWGNTPGHWEQVTEDILKMTSPGTTFIVHLLPDGRAIVTSAVGSSVTLTPL